MTPRSKDGFIWTKDTPSTEGLHTEAVVSGSPTIAKYYDAIVIGAGFAGLIAARELSANNDRSVLLLEARDRIGGRTWTANELGEEIEMGGTWVHWSQPHVYSELTRYGLHKNLKPSVAMMQPESSTHSFSSSSPPEPVDPEETFNAVDRLTQQFLSTDGETSRTLMPYPHDPQREPRLWAKYDHLTMTQRLDVIDPPERERSLFEAYMGLCGLGKPDDIGFTEVLRWYALSGHSMAAMYEQTSVYKLGKGGMTSFARALLSDVHADRLMSTQVVGISQANGQVYVRTKSGHEITARAVVSTIPLNCLPDIHFSPALEASHAEATQYAHHNTGAKLHFKLEAVQPLWLSTASATGPSATGPSPYLLVFADHNGTKPSGKDGTYVIAATKGNSVPDAKDSQTLIAEFKHIFQPGCDVSAYLVHDWATDQFSKGLWSSYRGLGMSRCLAALQGAHGAVFFASADWADGWRGFIDGALESGKKAARGAAEFLDAAPGRSSRM